MPAFQISMRLDRGRSTAEPIEGQVEAEHIHYRLDRLQAQGPRLILIEQTF